MPLIKRVLYEPAEYHNVEMFHEVSANTPSPNQDTLVIQSIGDRNMSTMIGVLNQLSSLSAFSLEMFRNLALLSEDMNDRVKILSIRTNTLVSKLPSVEKKVNSINLEPELRLVKHRETYLKNREMVTPSMFIKKTNYSSISSQYQLCRTLPQLWRIEIYVKDSEDIFKNYSYPGFFFQEWLRTEVLTQQAKKNEKKAAKVLRKQMKNERRKAREEREAVEAALRLEDSAYGDDEYDNDDTVNRGSGGKPRPKSLLLNKGGRSSKDSSSIANERNSTNTNTAENQSLTHRESQQQILLMEKQREQCEESETENILEAVKKKRKGMKSKLANVFGFSSKSKDKGSIQREISGKTDNEEEEENEEVVVSSEEETMHGVTARNKNRQDFGSNKGEALSSKTNKKTISNLFNNFTNKSNSNITTTGDEIEGDEDEAEVAESTENPTTDGGVHGIKRRPSMTMENMSLSLLTNRFGSATNLNSKSSAANLNSERNGGSSAVAAASSGRRSNMTRGEDDEDGYGDAVNTTTTAASAATASTTSIGKEKKTPLRRSEVQVNFSAYTDAGVASVEDTSASDMFNFKMPLMPPSAAGNGGPRGAGAVSRRMSVMRVGNNRMLTAAPAAQIGVGSGRKKQLPRPSSAAVIPLFEYAHTNVNHTPHGKTNRNNKRPEDSPAASVTSSVNGSVASSSPRGVRGRRRKSSGASSSSSSIGGAARNTNKVHQQQGIFAIGEGNEQEHDVNGDDDDGEEPPPEEGEEDEDSASFLDVSRSSNGGGGSLKSISRKHRRSVDRVDGDGDSDGPPPSDDDDEDFDGEESPPPEDDEEDDPEGGTFFDGDEENKGLSDDDDDHDKSFKDISATAFSVNSGGQRPLPPPPGAPNRGPPPPPPPPNMLIKKAAPPPPPPRPPSAVPEITDNKRISLLASIKSVNGLSGLQSNSIAATKTIDQQLQEQKKLRVTSVKQNEAVAAILANRSKIAGSDSESDSDDSDSDYTDDGY